MFAFKANSKWKMVQFGTGLNTLARYRGTTRVSGANVGNIDGTTNFFDYVAQSSYGIKPNSLGGIADAAYYYNFMKYRPESNDYFCVIGDYFNQNFTKETNGALREYIFTLGGNYNDKLFLGATLGVPFFNYTEKTTYTENLDTYFDTLGYDYLYHCDEFRASATGINLKLGIIYQPANYIRVGAAFHTPSWYPNVKESFRNEFDINNIYYLRSDTLYYTESDGEITYGEFKGYQLTTPYRAMANVAFIFKKHGFINLDYEFTDYSTSTLQSNSYNFNNENNATRKYYQPAHTVRIGGELNLSPIALRLGYAFSSNPYSKYLEKDGTQHTISGGIGLKGKTLFADFGYMYRFTNDKDVFYDAPLSINPYSSSLVNQVFTLTLGLKL